MELRKTGVVLLKQMTSKSEESATLSLSQNGPEMLMLPHLLAESEQPCLCSLAAVTTSISGSHRAQKNQRPKAIAVED